MNRRTLLATLPLVGAVAYLVAPDAAMAGSIVNAYNASALFSASVLAAVVMSRSSRPRWPWFLLVAAVVLWAIGDAIYELVEPDGSLSAADPFYVVGYGLVIASLGGVLRTRTRQHDLDSVLDSLLVGITTGLLLWSLAPPPPLAYGAWSTDMVAAVMYPILDVVLAMLLARLLLIPGQGTTATILMLGGVAAIFVGDLGYMMMASSGTDSASVVRVVDFTYLAGYALFPLAAAWPARVSAPVAVVDTQARGRMLVAGLALLALPAAAATTYLFGTAVAPHVVVLGATLIAPLVLWRMLRISRASDRDRRALAGQRHYFRAVATYATDAYLLVDASGIVLDASAALEHLLGLDSSEIIDSIVLDSIAESDRDRVESLLEQSLGTPRSTMVTEARIPTAPDTTIWVEIRCTNLLDDPLVGGLVINLQDITRRHQVEEDIAHLAFHDPLTGLANRALLKDRFDQAFSRRERTHSDVIVICGDLDGFKSVNDTLGHDAGDRLLRIVADRLTRAVRPTDTVARLGGDEFAILLDSPRINMGDAMEVGARILAAVSLPIPLDGRSVTVTASLGLAAASDGIYGSGEGLLRDADAALYRAKREGRNCVRRFQATIDNADESAGLLAS